MEPVIGVAERWDMYRCGLIRVLQESQCHAVEVRPESPPPALDLLILGLTRESGSAERCVTSAKRLLVLVDDTVKDSFSDTLETLRPLSVVHKSAPRHILMEAVESSLNDDSYVDSKILHWFSLVRSERLRRLGLTRRESQVVDHLLLGMSNKEIAVALGISLSTVKFHVGSVLSKTGAMGRTGLLSLFVQDPRGPYLPLADTRMQQRI